MSNLNGMEKWVEGLQPGMRIEVTTGDNELESVYRFVLGKTEASDTYVQLSSEAGAHFVFRAGDKLMVTVLSNPVEEAIAGVLNELDDLAYWDPDVSGVAAPKFLELLEARGFKVVAK